MLGSGADATEGDLLRSRDGGVLGVVRELTCRIEEGAPNCGPSVVLGLPSYLRSSFVESVAGDLPVL